MAGGLWNKVKGFGQNVVKNSRKANYINRAIKWGAIGGAVGGVAEWAQGGSFFEGAKSGALTGAVAGIGYTAFKAGTRDTAKIRKNANEMLRKRVPFAERSAAWKAKAAAGVAAEAAEGAGKAAADNIAQQAAETVASAASTVKNAAAGGAGQAAAQNVARQAASTVRPQKISNAQWAVASAKYDISRAVDAVAHSRPFLHAQGAVNAVAQNVANNVSELVSPITNAAKSGWGRVRKSKQVIAIERNIQEARKAKQIMNNTIYNKYKNGLF